VTELERIRRFLRQGEDAVCDELRPARYGSAMLTPSLPLVWQLNALRVEDGAATADELEAEAERLLAGFGHRKLVVPDETLGARIAPSLGSRGWNVYRLLVMVRRRPPDRLPLPGSGAEVNRSAGAAVLSAFRREQPFGSQSEAVRQLAQMDDRFTRAVDGRYFAAPPQDPASACRLYSDGDVAQIDEVGTLESGRNRGLARAAVLAAADAAEAAGNDLVFLLTDASDWPQRLYRRLGFDTIGSVYELLKLPLGSARP
jgi:ribosomal protein S18 acetylase RimI-like enzyme